MATKDTMEDIDRKNFLCKSALENGRTLEDVIEMWEWIKSDENSKEWELFQRMKNEGRLSAEECNKQVAEYKESLENGYDEISKLIVEYGKIKESFDIMINAIDKNNPIDIKSGTYITGYMFAKPFEEMKKTSLIKLEIEGKTYTAKSVVVNKEGGLIISTERKEEIPVPPTSIRLINAVEDYRRELKYKINNEGIGDSPIIEL